MQGVRGSIEDIIRTSLKDDAAAAFAAADDIDVSEHIKHAAETLTLMLQTTTRAFADKIKTKLGEKTLLESIETLRSKQAAMETDLKIFVVEKFQALEKDRNKINIGLTNDIAAVSRRVLEAIETVGDGTRSGLDAIADRLVKLENNTTLEQRDVQMSMKLTEISLKLGVNATRGLQGETGAHCLCHVRPPPSVIANYSAWREQPPAEDDLDTYLIMTTACSFKALEYNKTYYSAKTKYDGRAFEWVVAVRAQGGADLAIWWKSIGYSLFIGENKNTRTRLRTWRSPVEWKHSTPGVLSSDRYVPFYFRLTNGTLSSGKACESEPLFKVAVDVKPGEELSMLFKTWSDHGSKFLYDCPAHSPAATGAG